MNISRRTILAGVSAAATAAAQRQRTAPRNWKPKLGILCRYTPANLEFARKEGFTSVQFMGGEGLDSGKPVDDAAIAAVKAKAAAAGIYISSLGENGNHIDPDAAKRRAVNERMKRCIEIAGKLGVKYIGTQSGTLPDRPLQEQVDQIVRVYNNEYFPLCQKYGVRILWEPWAGGPNIATGPVAYEALFKAFGNSDVGLQFDPSHLQWQMMDPVQAARDFIDRIYDVHLKDAEIQWDVLRKTGIQPVNKARWWRFRLPGDGSVDWKGFFTVLAEAGYTGAMNIENEDEFYYPPYDASGNFTEQFQRGFRLAHAWLKQWVPEEKAA